MTSKRTLLILVLNLLVVTVLSQNCANPGPGYKRVGRRKSCEDIDECADEVSPCGDRQDCINTEGSYDCKCEKGFTAATPSTLCIDINECMEDPNICGPNANCTNTIGNYYCTCEDGFINSRVLKIFHQRDTVTCLDVDECVYGGPCGKNAACHNTIGSYNCVCNTGFKLRSGKSTFTEEEGMCEDICTIDKTICGNGTCHRTDNGRYHCACHHGFTNYGNDESHCADIDECDDEVSPCGDRQDCINTEGSYDCKCEKGFTAATPSTCIDPPEKPSVSASPPGGVVEGSTVTLTCSSEAKPPVDTYTWYRDGGITSISTGPQLVKDNVSPADAGQYFCQATNTHGSQRSPPHALDVQFNPTVHTMESDDVRLVEGTGLCTGKLEVRHQGEWKPAADFTSNWNLQSSSVVCRQLGCSSAVDHKWRSGSTRQPVWWITSSCVGSESSLRECVTMQAGHSVEILEVICSESDVRLVEGTSLCTGKLEVRHQGEWKPAADFTSNWNLQSSSVVCRQLGCRSAVDHKWRSGSTRQPVWWITSSCVGSESSLRECVTMQAGHSVERLEVICSVTLSKHCGPPEVLQMNSIMKGTRRDVYAPGEKVFYECMVGYTWTRGGPHSVTCVDGQWTRLTRQCGRKCGKRIGNMLTISGGTLSQPGDHPWQVSLQRKRRNTSNAFGHVCGGVLIHSCWVLTAAHCVKTNGTMDMQVVLGGVDKGIHEEEDQIVEVVRDFIHGEYWESKINKNPRNDIALLQLGTTNGAFCANETSYVTTACLPDKMSPDGTKCWISGWGETEDDIHPSKLSQGQVSLMSHERCMKFYGSQLDDTMICGENKTGLVSTCRGDSGGPVICKDHGVHYVAGLASWGSGACDGENPNVYTDVHRQVQWISRCIASYGKQCKTQSVWEYEDYEV